MANALFTTFKKHLLDGDIALLADDIKVVGIDHTDYEPDPASDEFLSDISAGIVFTSDALDNKVTDDGIFGASDITLTGVTGDGVDSLVIYQDTGDAATSILIAFIDTGAGLPYTPSGGDITIVWDTGSDKIFAL
jgi:hypothetical protein